MTRLMQPGRPWATRVSPEVAPTVRVKKGQRKHFRTFYKTVDTPTRAMTLYFSIMPLDGYVPSQCVCCAEFDVQLEVINSFVALGNVLVSAYLINEGGIRLDLPVEAFDGASVTKDLRKLTLAYQHELRDLT